MRVPLAVLAAFLASSQNSELSVSAFQPSRDLNRQSTRLNDASAVPYLENWKLLPDGNIQGIIFGHPFLENGDMVTTSQIKDSEAASENQIIETESGSQYLLRDRNLDSSEGEIGMMEQQGFDNNYAGPLLGGAALAAGAIGFGMSGEGARFDTAAPAQTFKEMSVASLSQIKNFEKSVEHALDMPYLASQVSEAEKQFQAARENMFKRRGPGSETAAVSPLAKQKNQQFEQALSVAAQKVAIEKAALNEMHAWENVVNNEIMKEKAQTDAMNTASSAAAKALSENKFDEAEAATERAKMARAAVMEIQAERESAILAEESAEAEELFAEQDVMKVMNDIKQMATMYSVKAAQGFKPAEVLYMFGDLANTEKLGQYMSTTEGQVAVGSIAAAASVGTLWAAGKRDSEETEETTSMASTTTDAKKVEAAPVTAKSTTTSAPSTPANGASADDKSNWGSYLDVLGSYSSGTATVQSSYSPFGKKASGMTSHTSLYGPPAATTATPAAATASTTAPAPAAPVATATATAAPVVEATATTTTTTTNTAPAPHHNGRSSFGSSGYLDALSGPPGARVMTSYSPFAPKSPVTVAAKKPEIAAHIRLAYNEWCEYYGKKSDESRLQIFADNFAQAKEFYKESGRALLLNEFADLTASEYKMLPNTA